MTEPDLRKVRQSLAEVSPLVEVVPKIDSTNTRALALVDVGAPHGAVVWANEQTMGRGRLGREWFSPPGQNLYLSVVLRPALLAVEASQFTLDAAVAVANCLESVIQRNLLRLKWPNDLVILDESSPSGFRKLGGILTELRVRGAAVEGLVVGVGINIGTMRGTPVESIAVGLEDVLTTEYLTKSRRLAQLRRDIACGIVSALSSASSAFVARGGFDRAAWLSHALSFGRRVEVRMPAADAYIATTDSLDETGCLCVRRGNRVESIIAGELEYLGG